MITEAYQTQLAQAIFASGALTIKTDGTLFTLKSKRRSNWLVNLKETVLTPEYAELIASGLLTLALENDDITHVGGVAMGGIPLVSNVVMLSNSSPRKLRGYYVRPEAKDHGTGNKVDGCNPNGLKSAMLEDVTSTAGSMLVSIDGVPGVVLGAAVLDRSEGEAGKKFAERGIAFHSLITTEHLQPFAPVPLITLPPLDAPGA